MKLSKADITAIANSVGLGYPEFKAFITVESGGLGFDPATGKIIIQFEPTWFHRYLDKAGIPHKFSVEVLPNKRKQYAVSTDKVSFDNGVEGQAGEWEAFNKAWQIHPQSAMLSTSIGCMQIMGFHYSMLGYKTVGEMWDTFKKGEYQQIAAGARFLKANPALFHAVATRNWPRAAYFYNGEGYEANHYDVHLAAAYTAALRD